MPFRILFSNPFAFSVLTVVAIGVITYEILKKKRIVQTGGYYRDDYRDDDDDDDPSLDGDDDAQEPDKPDNDGDPHEADKSDETAAKFSSDAGDDKLENSNKASEIRKRTVGTSNPSDKPQTEKSDDDDPRKPDKLDITPIKFSSIAGDDKLGNPNKDSVSSESNNLQANSEKTFVPNIDDEDSDSSESNNSLQNNNISMGLDESIYNIPSSSTTRSSSPIDNSEEIYKRKVCNYLKTDIDEGNCKEKCYQNFSDKESDISKNNFSVTSEVSNSSGVFMKKLEMCKGCLEEFANAVAYPCKHCYLCLDCAVKVHRIYKKCTICQSVIKTFEQLKI